VIFPALRRRVRPDRPRPLRRRSSRTVGRGWCGSATTLFECAGRRPVRGLRDGPAGRGRGAAVAGGRPGRARRAGRRRSARPTRRAVGGRRRGARRGCCQPPVRRTGPGLLFGAGRGRATGALPTGAAVVRSPVQLPGRRTSTTLVRRGHGRRDAQRASRSHHRERWPCEAQHVSTPTSLPPPASCAPRTTYSPGTRAS
jgi:hypothetical protein